MISLSPEQLNDIKEFTGFVLEGIFPNQNWVDSQNCKLDGSIRSAKKFAISKALNAPSDEGIKLVLADILDLKS